MELNYYECEYCKNKFKKETYLAKHQKNAKYCLNIRNKIKNGQEIIEEVKNLELIQDDNITKLENQKLNEIHDSFLEFENNKLLLENEYNINISNILDKQDLKNNIEEYYSIEKNKITKLQELYCLFEKNKICIEEKYQNFILEENKNWKGELKQKKIKELESSFDSIKNKINILIDTTEDIDHAQDILNQFIFNLNLNLGDGAEGDDKKLSSTEDNYKPFDKLEDRQNEDIENKLLYHLIILLQDQKLKKDTLLYIIVELMKYINNFDIKGEEKKSSILYILTHFIDTNDDDIENKEDMKKFLSIFSNNFIDIISAISDKKIRIKLKKSCFFPLCF